VKLVDRAAMQRMDRRAGRHYGIKELVLMENAGRGVAEVAFRFIRGENRRVSVLAGKGNNGGDGLVAARHLANRGCDVIVYLLTNAAKVEGNARINLLTWEKMGGAIEAVETAGALERHLSPLRHSAVIVDAIFGTGLSQTVKGHYKTIIDAVNGLGPPVVSVDIPSGLDATTGRVLGCSVRAEITATMALPKIGLVTYPGADRAGEVEVVDIGMPRALTGDDSIPWNYVGSGLAGEMVAARGGDAHKGSCGHLLVIAGSPGKTGAAVLTAMGGLRSGAGLVTLGVPESVHGIAEEKTTEVMTAPLPECSSGTVAGEAFAAVKELIEGKGAVVFGPGLGATGEVRHILKGLIEESTVPLVIDADGLNVLAGHLRMLKGARAPLILTPHPGEMARLIGSEAARVQENRVAVASDFAKKHKVTVVLKGARTVTAFADGRVFINSTGNPGMATAGTGDLLAGIMGGLIVQGATPPDAAVAAVYLHGRAGDSVAAKRGEIGMVATDMLEEVPSALSALGRASGRGAGEDLLHIVS